MSNHRLHQVLIHDLGAGLVAVRHLPPPWVRTTGWLLAALAIAAVLLARYGSHAMLQRWAAVGAVITMLSAPGPRSRSACQTAACCGRGCPYRASRYG